MWSFRFSGRPSPPPLHTQARSEITAKHVLAEMVQLTLEIGEDLAAEIAPQPAERKIFRQIAPGIRIDAGVTSTRVSA